MLMIYLIQKCVWEFRYPVYNFRFELLVIKRRCWVKSFFFFFPPTEDLLPPGFPNIDMGPQLKVVERTRTATMLCAASGNPDPEITWYKDFLPIDPSASNGRIKQLRSGKENSNFYFFDLSTLINL